MPPGISGDEVGTSKIIKMNAMNQRLLEWNPFKELNQIRNRLSNSLFDSGNGNG